MSTEKIGGQGLDANTLQDDKHSSGEHAKLVPTPFHVQLSFKDLRVAPWIGARGDTLMHLDLGSKAIPRCS